MEKFKKLDRAQMKQIQGGQPLCDCGQIVECNCDGEVLCAFVQDNCDFGETPAGACQAAGCEGSASNGCFDSCPL